VGRRPGIDCLQKANFFSTATWHSPSAEVKGRTGGPTSILHPQTPLSQKLIELLQSNKPQENAGREHRDLLQIYAEEKWPLFTGKLNAESRGGYGCTAASDPDHLQSRKP